MTNRLLGFHQRTIDVGDAAIHTLIAGQGEPLLLLHGYPQTHMMWHRVAPALAERFTVVLTDLRGYGQSSCPDAGLDHMGYSKRTMATDQVRVMEHLGYHSFFLAGHDRGARVCHQLMLDHPDRVRRAVFLDIIPTTEMYARTDREMATIYYHWFFFIQQSDYPEQMIAANPERVVRGFIQWLSNRQDVFPDDVMAHYVANFSNPAVIHATCEDYRAGATVDLDHLRSSGKIQPPLLVLWGAPGLRRYDVLDIWRRWADNVCGFLVENSGHYIAEEDPDITIRAFETFFAPDAPVPGDDLVHRIQQTASV